MREDHNTIPETSLHAWDFSFGLGVYGKKKLHFVVYFRWKIYYIV